MISFISSSVFLFTFNNASMLSFTWSSGISTPCLLYRRRAFLLLGTLTRLVSHNSQSVTVTRSSPPGIVRSSTALMMIPGLHPFRIPFFAWRLHLAPKVSSSSYTALPISFVPSTLSPVIWPIRLAPSWLNSITGLAL